MKAPSLKSALADTLLPQCNDPIPKATAVGGAGPAHFWSSNAWLKPMLTAALRAYATFPVAGSDGFLSGDSLPTDLWQFYQDSGLASPAIVSFLDPDSGLSNQALRIISSDGSEAGAVTEYYQGSFAADQIVGAARFRLVDFTATGKENLLCVTTSPVSSDTNAPSPALTLVDGRLKLWNYVFLDTEIADIGPAVSNEWHTAYLSTRKDGQTKLWWDGALVFDGMAPPANPYGGYFEWGSGSWQADAADTVDFDWVGFPTAGGGAPVLLSTSPEDGTPFHNPADGFSFTVVNTAFGVDGTGVKVSVNGQDRTADLVISGNSTNLHGELNGIFAPDRIYQVQLQLTDLASNVLSSSVHFQTFAESHYVFEAEDWNFDGGNWLDDIVLSSFPGPSNYVERVDLPGIDELDFGELGDGAEHFYRLSSMVGTEYTGDW